MSFFFSSSSSSAAATAPRPLLKFARLNLNVDPYGRRISRRLTRYTRVVSWFWVEKVGGASCARTPSSRSPAHAQVALLLSFLQLWALLYLLSAPWPWPFVWQRWSRFVLLFALDAGGFQRARGAAFDNAGFSAFLLLLVPLLGAAVWALHRFYYGAAAEAQREEEGRQTVPKVLFKHGAVLLAEFLYVPLLLVAFRLLVCDGGRVVHIDSALECGGAAHVVLLLLALATAVPFAVALPLWLRRRTVKAAVFTSGDAHDKYLRSREVEFLLGLNDYYERDSVYLASSLRRPWAHWRAVQCAQKALLVADLTLLGPEVAGAAAQQAQAILFCLLIALPPAAAALVRRFRCESTQRAASVLEWTLTASALLGALSSKDRRSAFLVDKTLTITLAAINLFGLALFLLTLAWAVARRQRWPVTEADVQRLMLESSDMLAAINEAKQLVHDSVECPPEFTDQARVREAAERLSLLHRRARAEQHVLEWSLQDLTETVALLHENCRARSLLPNPPLVSLLAGLGPTLTLKSHDALLRPAAKTRMLQGLLVARFLLGDEFARAADRSEWFERQRITVEAREEHERALEAARRGSLLSLAISQAEEDESKSETYSEVELEEEKL
jgi:hypothetical protein